MVKSVMVPDMAAAKAPEGLRIHYSSSALRKRIFDIAVSGTMIVLLAPLMALVALLIVVVDGMPVIFAHNRVGRDGKTFRCLKFRTMVKDAPARLEKILAENPAARREWDESQKLKHDPRILPMVGHVLRKSSLDELPQLFNVLRGEMSMVGPRPVTEAELARYGTWETHYTSVRPGLTGPWQISGRNDDSYDTRVEKDVDYIENWKLRKDLRIVFQTAKVVIGRNGAY